MIEDKTLNLDQWEDEVFLGATDLIPELLGFIESDVISHSSLKSLRNTLASDIQSTEEEWMFI